MAIAFLPHGEHNRRLSPGLQSPETLTSEAPGEFERLRGSEGKSKEANFKRSACSWINATLQHLASPRRFKFPAASSPRPFFQRTELACHGLSVR